MWQEEEAQEEAMSTTKFLHFPGAGIYTGAPLYASPPYASQKGSNVRAVDTQQERARGGSRRNLVREYADPLVEGKPIRGLQTIQIANSDGFVLWQDVFRETLGSVWSRAVWANHGIRILPEDPNRIVYDDSGGIVRDAFESLDSSQSYFIRVYLIPYDDAYYGKFHLYARLDNSSPDIETVGIDAELIMTDGAGTYSGNLYVYADESLKHTYTMCSYATWSGTKSYQLGDYVKPVSGATSYVYEATTAGISGATEPAWPTTIGDTVNDGTVTWTCRDAKQMNLSEPGWFDLLVNGNAITVTWRGKTILSESDISSYLPADSGGHRMGIGLETTVAGGINIISHCRIGYYSSAVQTEEQTITVAICDGRIFKDTGSGSMQAVDLTSDYSVWEAGTSYTYGDYVKPTGTGTGYLYQCTTGGTSHATTEPTWPTTVGDTVTDNDVVWICRSWVAHDRFLHTIDWGGNENHTAKVIIADYGSVKISKTNGQVAANGTDLTHADIADWRIYDIDPKRDVVILSSVTGSTVANAYGIAAVEETKLVLDLGSPALTNGEGTCTFEVRAGIKTYDPVTDELAILKTDVVESSTNYSKGFPPHGCRMVTRWLDSILYAGEPNNAWYASRVADPYDHQYGLADDESAAVGG
ncbi:MAG: hypothetical protein DRP01_04920, partial [Archaeoglobales archaeon]